MRTKITRAPCTRRTGAVVPRAENSGDFVTADYKVLCEGCESRNNHRYAVVVQDLATQWIGSCPCKTKTSQEREKSLQKFLEPTWKPKVIYTDNSLEFGKSCEDLSWNHCTSTPHRSETNGIAEIAVRRIKEGTSAVLLQSGLDEQWWADSMECCCHLRDLQDLLSDGKTLYERANRRTIQRTNFSIWCNGRNGGRISPYFLLKTCRDCIILAQKSYQAYSLDMRCTRGESGMERRHLGRRH